LENLKKDDVKPINSINSNKKIIEIYNEKEKTVLIKANTTTNKEINLLQENTKTLKENASEKANTDNVYYLITKKLVKVLKRIEENFFTKLSITILTIFVLYLNDIKLIFVTKVIVDLHRNMIFTLVF
jgi:hypothetical protein